MVEAEGWDGVVGGVDGAFLDEMRYQAIEIPSEGLEPFVGTGRDRFEIQFNHESIHSCTSAYVNSLIMTITLANYF